MRRYGMNQATEFSKKQISVIYGKAKAGQLKIEKWLISRFYDLADFYGIDWNRGIEKDISNRMASTVRHNRARGSHDIDLMVNIVAELKESGMSDAWILKHLGMDAEELLRLKQISGLASLFADKEFSDAWE